MAVRFCYHQNYSEMHCDYFGRSYSIWSIHRKQLWWNIFLFTNCRLATSPKKNSISSKSRQRRCFVKKMFLKVSQNSLESACARVWNLLKNETLAQVFSCEFCEFLQSSHFKGHFRATVSDCLLLRDSVVADVIIFLFLRGLPSRHLHVRS